MLTMENKCTIAVFVHLALGYKHQRPYIIEMMHSYKFPIIM